VGRHPYGRSNNFKEIGSVTTETLNDKYMQRPGYETKTWDASSLTSYITQGLRTTCHLLDYNNRSNPREDIYAQTACRREGNRLLLVMFFGGRNPDRFFPMTI